MQNKQFDYLKTDVAVLCNELWPKKSEVEQSKILDVLCVLIFPYYAASEIALHLQADHSMTTDQSQFHINEYQLGIKVELNLNVNQKKT